MTIANPEKNRRSTPHRWATCISFVFAAANADTLGAQTIQEFDIGADKSPNGIVAGPDGNLWFTESKASQVGVISTEGILLTEFPTKTPDMGPGSIVLGADDNLWFDEVSLHGHAVSRITPMGDTSEYLTPCVPQRGMVSGPQNSVWFGEVGCADSQDRIAKIVTIASPGAPVGTISQIPIGGSKNPESLVAPADGNVWFAEFGAGAMARLTLAGMLSEFAPPTPSQIPDVVTIGPDSNIWFSEFNQRILGRCTLTGTITEFAFPMDGVTPIGAITTGTDGNLWVGDISHSIWRAVLTGTSLVQTQFPISGRAGVITPGPDGNLWFTEPIADKIGVVHMDGIFRDQFGPD